MDSSDRGRSSGKKYPEMDMDAKGGKLKDDNDLESDDKRKHRSNKSRKHELTEESEGVDGSVKQRSSGDKNDNRKRSSGSARTDTDLDGYESRKESRSKQAKKNLEESTLEKLSNWYEEKHAENKHNSASREYTRTDENERRITTSKLPDNGSSHIKTTDKDEISQDGDPEKVMDKDSRFSDKSESSREKGRGSSEYGRHSRRRWDESDSSHIEKSDLRTEKSTDSCLHSAGERSEALKTDIAESKLRVTNPDSDKCNKTHDIRERKDESERVNFDILDDPKENINGTFSNEESRHLSKVSGGDTTDSQEKLSNEDKDGISWTRGKSKRETDGSDKSRTPERSGRHNDPENLEMDYERNYSGRRKEHERDPYRDDKLNGRDNSWSDRSRDRDRDREGSRDSWRKRQASLSDRGMKDMDAAYEPVRNWDLTKRGWIDHERHEVHSGGRKDDMTEAVKTSSNYGIAVENYDVIEIQTKSFDYGKEESRSVFSRSNEVCQISEALASNDEGSPHNGEERVRNSYGSTHSGEDLGHKGGLSVHASGGPCSSGSQPSPGTQEPFHFMRSGSQGMRGNRFGRGGRGRPTGRESQQVGPPMPLMGSPFGMPPPGAMQSTMSPAPGPPMSPGVFITPFQPPVMWSGGRGIEMNMLAVPPVMSSVPPGIPGPRFLPNMGVPPNPHPYFNQTAPIRGAPPSFPGPNINLVVPAGRGQTQDKVSGGWVPNRNVAPPGKAPSRGEQNDYSQNFVDTGMRPQNFIRELELTSVVEDYPKLRELIQKKDEIVAKAATPPMYLKCDLKEQTLSPELFGTKFDVILVDPPWEEYVHRAPGVTDHMEYWTFEEIMNLKIEAIADTPSFIFLWVGDGVGLEQGRQCLKKWGFRRCEDICWVKTNKTTATPGLRHDSHTLFQRSKEHCLMGIKGTVRRSTDGHVIHANIDTDVIIAEEPPYGSTAKPEDMYKIVEHFALGRRRLELFGEDHNIRTGWMTIGQGLSSSNFNSEGYCRTFADKDGKVWQGGGGRNPPIEAPHLIQTTPEIEALRPKSPMKNQQQQSSSISLTPGNPSLVTRTIGNPPQTQTQTGQNMMNQEGSNSNMSTTGHWGASSHGMMMMGDDRVIDIYGYNNAPPSFDQKTSVDFIEHGSQRVINML